MKNEILYGTDFPVYPGAFVPSCSGNEAEDELPFIPGYDPVAPNVHVTEMADSFEVEMSVPGAKREDFFIYADGNILSIRVKGEKSAAGQRNRFLVSKPDETRKRHNIILPNDADTEFISAEYNDGALHFCVPKIRHAARPHHTRIIVY